ncbi:hypothetical protein GOBAR_DD00637 [Gossypium barbadense]|nr:hypothetical protein GOBAR_DD00637 [Gossypium barbadense]
MAAGTMATAAGAAVIQYYVWLRKSEVKTDGVGSEEDEDLSKSSRSVKRRIVRRPAQAPATWLEAIATISETLRFTYSETLGKWPIGDLAFGINYLMRRQGNFEVASVYAGDNCVELKGEEIKKELNNLLRLLTLCRLFSKKPFPVFLDSAGYSEEDALLHKPKAGLMKPAFTIIRDENSKCFLLLIRGTHSIKDTLTAATGAVVPFHHSVLHDGGVSNLVLGYAHCGMVAAARWIAKLTAPCLLKAIAQYPDYKVKIVGHSLGGGTAALLTYILREHKEFAASTTCFTFAPGKTFPTYYRFISKLSVNDVNPHHFHNKPCSCVYEGLDHNDTDEDEPLIEMDRGITTSTTDEFVGGELWYELEKELKRQESEVDLHGCAEEAAAAKEISEQENVIAADVSSESRSAISSSDASENLRFYPPGRIMHIVAMPSSDAAVLDDHDGDGNGDGSNNGKVRIYETPRELYSKIRLSRTMINDHYMPMYKKMMELLIIELEKDEDCKFDVLQD